MFPKGPFLVKISVAVFTLVFRILFIRFTHVDDVASREPFEGFHTRLSPRLTKQVRLLGVAFKLVLNNQLLGVEPGIWVPINKEVSGWQRQFIQGNESSTHIGKAQQYSGLVVWTGKRPYG